MKKLSALINPKGKSMKQLASKLWQAFRSHKAENKDSDSDDLIIDVTEQELGMGFEIMGIPQKSKDSDNKTSD